MEIRNFNLHLGREKENVQAGKSLASIVSMLTMPPRVTLGARTERSRAGAFRNVRDATVTLVTLRDVTMTENYHTCAS